MVICFDFLITIPIYLIRDFFADNDKTGYGCNPIAYPSKKVHLPHEWIEIHMSYFSSIQRSLDKGIDDPHNKTENNSSQVIASIRWMPSFLFLLLSSCLWCGCWLQLSGLSRMSNLIPPSTAAKYRYWLLVIASIFCISSAIDKFTYLMIHTCRLNVTFLIYVILIFTFKIMVGSINFLDH